MFDSAATDEQMNVAHPFEDRFERWISWTFENLFRKYALQSESPEELDNFIRNYGQSALNIGNRRVADAWAEFAARKYVVALELEIESV